MVLLHPEPMAEGGRILARMERTAAFADYNSLVSCQRNGDAILMFLFHFASIFFVVYNNPNFIHRGIT